MGGGRRIPCGAQVSHLFTPRCHCLRAMRVCLTRLGVPADREANAKELAAKTATIEDAKVNHGEVEVLDAIMALADFHARIGNKVSLSARAVRCPIAPSNGCVVRRGRGRTRH